LCSKCNKNEKNGIRKGITNIIVPVDISIKSVKALDAAIYLSKHLGSSITVMHVIPTVQIGSKFFLADILKELEKTAQISVESAKDYCDKRNIVAKHVIVRGDEPEQIIKTAKKYHQDLIIMGSGKGVLKEAIFGSISNYVVHNSNIPILIVKENSKSLETRIDKFTKKPKKQKLLRQGGGKSFSKMKEKVEHPSS
jgi:nucleotide-binding universal stress UspA family protein